MDCMVPFGDGGEVLGRLWLLVRHGVLEDPEMHLVTCLNIQLLSSKFLPSEPNIACLRNIP